jgi:HD-GYP domain-containing protein (c-di-GMP phosphodiesterase class II)
MTQGSTRPPADSQAERSLPPGALGRVVEALLADERLPVDIDWEPGIARVRKDGATLLLVECDSLEVAPIGDYYDAFAEGRVGIVLIGTPPRDSMSSIPKNAVIHFVEDETHAESLFVEVAGAFDRLAFHSRAEEKSKLLSRYRFEVGELITIARALTQERDIDRLLALILEKSRYITGADAGSIYVLDGADADVRRRTLHFKLSQNDSCAFESREFTMPVSTRSVVGSAVIAKSIINIADVYAIPPNAPYAFDRTFDERVGYRTCSMLTIPMLNAQNDVIGVIQLINKKRSPHVRLASTDDFSSLVVQFDERSEELLATLASQAAIALENAMLYKEIHTIFEGFVHASVRAIEQRDPTTSGHSLRVSLLSCRLAEAVDRVDTGPYAFARFSMRDLKELEYASMLHDFGKIGVREQVLVKAKKLHPHQVEAIRSRFDFVVKATEADVLARKLDAMKLGKPAAVFESLDAELRSRVAEIEAAWGVIVESNEPTVLRQGDFTRIAEIGAMAYRAPSGEAKSLLLPDEVVSLQVTRGSLTAAELDEIRSHVVHTYNFLSQIPWGRTYNRIPEIAGSHHEKLNGTGYPRRLNAEEIPLQSKIMSIADIFDALTARDRPYKKSLPIDRALEILGYEVKEGHVDADLVKLFRDQEIFRVVEKDLAG